MVGAFFARNKKGRKLRAKRGKRCVAKFTIMPIGGTFATGGREGVANAKEKPGEILKQSQE